MAYGYGYGHKYCIAYPNGKIEEYEYAGSYQGGSLIVVDQREAQELYQMGARIRPIQQCYNRYACIVDADNWRKEKARVLGWDRMNLVAYDSGMGSYSTVTISSNATTSLDYQVLQYAVDTLNTQKSNKQAEEKKKILAKEKKHKENIRKLYWARQSKDENRKTREP